MVRRDHEHKPVYAERQDLETRHLDRAGNDPDIGRAVGDGGDDLVAEPLLQIDVDLRMGGEKVLSGSGKNSVSALVFDNSRICPLMPRILGEVAAHAFALLQQHPRMVKQSAPGLRRVDTLALTVQERRAAHPPCCGCACSPRQCPSACARRHG
jgi:hypothetical protein